MLFELKDVFPAKHVSPENAAMINEELALLTPLERDSILVEYGKCRTAANDNDVARNHQVTQSAVRAARRGAINSFRR
jgi:hypothetical protein